MRGERADVTIYLYIYIYNNELFIEVKGLGTSILKQIQSV